LGKKYGVSKEAVRQWINKINGYGVFNNPNGYRKNKDLSCWFHPANKVALCSGGSMLSGAIVEKRFYYKCLELGLNIFPSKDISFDFIVNDKIVDVKSSHKPRIVGNKNDGKYFSFKATYKQSHNADFLACFHPYEDCFFILPKEYFHGRLVFYIRESKSNRYNACNKIWEYKDAFNLF
jgi:hypothetical protein